jgi:hypothetical protein
MKIISRVAIVLLILTPAVFGGVVTTDQWYEFYFGIAGSWAVDCAGGCGAGTGVIPLPVDAGSPPWTITGDVVLTITDAFNSGDNFSAYDNNVLVGTTPLVATGNTCNAAVATCLASPNMSHGVFDLGPGAHSITIQTVTTEIGHGAAFFRVNESEDDGGGEGGAIPEPATCVLFATGLAGAWLLRKRLQPR